MSIKEGISTIKKLYGEDKIAAFVSIHAYSQVSRSFMSSPLAWSVARQTW
jgi:hypothetical protein